MFKRCFMVLAKPDVSSAFHRRIRCRKPLQGAPAKGTRYLAIRTELLWTDFMIHSLLQNPDSPNARRDKFTGGYTFGLYHRERVVAVAQSEEGRAAKRRWDETLRGNTPNPGWSYSAGNR
jgi:hypothetical protein